MKTKPVKFPLSVSRGSATVKIYREKKESGHYYRVSFYKGSLRCGLNFTDLDEAKKEAEAKAAQLSRGDLDALQVTGRDRLIYGRALEAIRPLDMALDAAAIEFADAKKHLAGFSLIEAARFYMRHHGRGITTKPVIEAVEEMIAAKTEKGVSPTYLADQASKKHWQAAAWFLERKAPADWCKKDQIKVSAEEGSTLSREILPREILSDEQLYAATRDIFRRMEQQRAEAASKQATGVKQFQNPQLQARQSF